MTLKSDIENKVAEIIDNNFEVTDISYIPKLDDPRLTFGNTGLKFTGSVVFIDMRGSTKLLNNHNKTTVAKLHMSYFHTVVKIANSLNGHVRSFNGDSALIFFQGNYKETISTAVKCAMQITYMLTNDDSAVSKKLKKYSELDFGIGVDHGDILCTKIGIGGDHNRDIFWIGNSVNKSTVLGDESNAPEHISISNYVYSNLLDCAKYGIRKNYLGEDEKVNMWTQSDFIYNESYETYYYTSWYWAIA